MTTDKHITQMKKVDWANSAFHPSPLGKSSTGLWHLVGCVHLCRVAGNTVIPYGKWRSVTVRRSSINSYTLPLAFYLYIVIFCHMTYKFVNVLSPTVCNGFLAALFEHKIMEHTAVYCTTVHHHICGNSEKLYIRTCESAVCIRIVSQIKSGVMIWIWVKSQTFPTLYIYCT